MLKVDPSPETESPLVSSQEIRALATSSCDKSLKEDVLDLSWVLPTKISQELRVKTFAS